MKTKMILASGSEIRATLLANSGLSVSIEKPRIDEETVKASLLSHSAPPRDIADKLAELKAHKIGQKFPDALVLGCDQVLDFEHTILSKPSSPDEAISQLQELRGKRHKLLSAAVIFHQYKPIWRHVGVVRLNMRQFSDTYLHNYVQRNWENIKHCVGGYQLENEGVRLFSKIEGDYFNVLGLPLVELLNFLTLRGDIEG